MCGILGFASKDQISKNVFKRMLDSMSFRGYDSEGFYLDNKINLGHKRLAIRDIKNGNQPMKYQNYIIVYNGEIYNCDSLKKILKEKKIPIKTNCDTEIVLKMYVLFKEKCLNYLEGIFSFAIYDTKTKKIFLARDQLGVKPLFYFKNKRNFIFSSTIKAILESKLIKPVITKKELGIIMSLGPSKPCGSGIFKDINELRAGHYMIYHKNKIKIKRYFKLKSKKCSDSFDEAKEKIKNLLINSICKQTISDEKIATLLSGGLDSSIITGIVSKKIDYKLSTYSINYEDNDKYFTKNNFTVSEDDEYIKLMADSFDTSHEFKVITQKQVVEYLKKALLAKDYPGMTDIDSSLLWLSEEIRKNYKVILSGECADEIFGGYPWFYNKINNKGFPWINNLDYREKLLKKKINLKKICYREYKKTIRELNFKDRKNKYKKLFYINMTHFMATLLDRKDRMTMYANLEARVPFANKELVSYLWNLPFNYKYQNNTEKYLLREAFRDILPKQIIERKKNPYPKTHNPEFKNMVANLLKERLNRDNCSLKKVFDIDEINKLIDDNNDSNLPWFGQLMTTPQLLAYLYQFDLWIELYNIEIKI